MPKTTAPPTLVRISDNTIIDGKFYARGEALPFDRAEDLPENLRPLVVTGEPEAEEPSQPRGSFQLNTPYGVDEDGRLTRALRRKVDREVAELEAKNAENEWLEEQVATSELSPELAAALQEEHDAAIGHAKAQAAADANRSDELADSVIAAQEQPTLFVRRGTRHYANALKARLKPGEDVFIRQPDGHFHCVGTTDGHGELPDLPIEL
jgi:hypothetical protein